MQFPVSRATRHSRRHVLGSIQQFNTTALTRRKSTSPRAKAHLRLGVLRIEARLQHAVHRPILHGLRPARHALVAESRGRTRLEHHSGHVLHGWLPAQAPFPTNPQRPRHSRGLADPLRRAPPRDRNVQRHAGRAACRVHDRADANPYRRLLRAHADLRGHPRNPAAVEEAGLRHRPVGGHLLHPPHLWRDRGAPLGQSSYDHRWLLREEHRRRVCVCDVHHHRVVYLQRRGDLRAERSLGARGEGAGVGGVPAPHCAPVFADAPAWAAVDDPLHPRRLPLCRRLRADQH
mmetsp:Transcript_384/g.1077  ORF Transcript_384/g.1077 Transcript_384/m.1077 type:complete len:290 (+) Transcript_384:17-886(+)